ncbi:juvenile hormone esterase-like isoform X2 [Macrosteles quadrilineatus]|nr:juvenile hormone esterase-like isoform X2 [Macrosteles quadrilineatus]
MKTRGGRQIAAFRGIPYAAPPTKQLRFKSPQPPEPWKGRRIAREDGHPCIQFHPFFSIHGEEDCLYLNVYSPNISNEEKLPVLFFIHGGAFRTGSAESFVYHPKFILDEDVVLVTVNYRLGVFGFLSLEDEVVPGNFGLKDQRAALRWVKENIEQFGGDPSAVTLFGESAGAASVHYHILFNSDEGLFRAGILHSGAALTAGSFQRPGDQKPLVQYLLDKTGCPEGDSASLLECLQKIPAFRLTRYVHLFSPPLDSLMRRIELSPTIEPDCVEDVFVTADPWNKTMSVPLIVGTNQYEGMFIIHDFLMDETNKKFNHFSSEFEKILPYNLMFNTSAEDPEYVSKQIREFYIDGKETKRENFMQLVDLISDGIFTYGVAKTVEKNTADTYLYSFNYLGSKSYLNLLGYENSYGPTHADELFMFFPMPFNRALRKENKTEEDIEMSQQLIKMWINFAHKLTPVPEGSEVVWESAGSDLQYLNINGPGNMSMESGYYKERVAFWENLPFRNKPLPDLQSCLA